MIDSITPLDLDRLRREGRPIELIDVRPAVDFRATHADIARSVPFTALDPASLLAARQGPADSPLYVICGIGVLSRMACKRFAESGFPAAVNVTGGTAAWEAAGLPVVHTKGAVSIERQVRLAAGSLVVLGVILAATVHPYFAGLSAFVGAGLVFAGVTNTCGMGMLMARMPWNG